MTAHTTETLLKEIRQWKEKNDVCILAHAYQSHEIWEAADYVGDSYGLSVKAANAPQQTILMCGVRFMAETAKILSPEKKVLLAQPLAGCPMADQYDRQAALRLREGHPGYKLAAYINTSAALKTVADVVVTSSSAVRILEAMPDSDILFVPDCQLGSWTAAQLPEKNIHLVEGGCPAHTRFRAADVETARRRHPQALLLCHPECLGEVTEHADYVGSTTGIIDFAKNSDAEEFIIGTECSIVQHLQYDCPDKRFYPLSTACVCNDMRITTLADVWHAVRGDGGEEIKLDEATLRDARRCIDRMIELGG
ncbi:MAG: quinolinate synthase NadA [Anaerovoracaceae bacterium]|jgi:quinolinate synthase